MELPSIAIKEGWGGGRWHTKLFVSELKTAGLKITNRAGSADVLFAHSVGCYDLPDNPRAKLIILVGPPYWPSKSILRRMFTIKHHDLKYTTANHGPGYTLNKTLWQAIYVILKPTYTWLAIRQHRRLHFLDRLNNKKIIVVRNKEDYYCSPEIETILQKYPSLHYVELPGPHDDYYTNPKPYVDLILKEL